MHRAPFLYLVLAAAVRALVALRTVVPDRDTSHYLWMAEQVASGEWSAAFATVFHPFYSLLVAALLAVAPGLSGVAAGQVVACGCAALAVLPLWSLSRRMFGAEAANVACFFYAVGVWFARHPADCLSEGPFYLLVGCAVLALTRVGEQREEQRGEQRGIAVMAGVLAAMAYWTRPEGAALALLGVPWLWLRGARGGAATCALAFVLAALLLPLGYAAFGSGFTLTPKAGFNYEVGVGSPEHGGIVHYVWNGLRLPGDLVEAIGYVATPLALIGVWRARPLPVRGVPALLMALVVMQCVMVPLLRSNIRFLSGYGMLLLPFAGASWHELRLRWLLGRRGLWAVLTLVAVAGDVVRLPQVRRADRAVEKELGEYVRARLAPGEAVVTEMPRLEYFAGLEPGPPRPIARAELLQGARAPRTRWVVVVEERSNVHAVDLEPLGYEPVVLPPPLEALVAARGLVVRRRP